MAAGEMGMASAGVAAGATMAAGEMGMATAGAAAGATMAAGEMWMATAGAVAVGAQWHEHGVGEGCSGSRPPTTTCVVAMAGRQQQRMAASMLAKLWCHRRLLRSRTEWQI